MSFTVTDIAFIQFSSAEDVVKAVKYDKKLLAGTAVHIVQCVDEEVTLPSEVDKKPSVVPGDGQPEDVSDHGRLFVRNLSFQCTGEDLEKLFGKYGEQIFLCSDEKRGYAEDGLKMASIKSPHGNKNTYILLRL